MCFCWTFFHRLYSKAEVYQLFSEPHPSDSRFCPKWKIEKQIQEIKTNKNLSYPEARKLIIPQKTQTYAQVVKTLTISTATQTDDKITQMPASKVASAYTKNFFLCP
ncbi:hypothetical protein TNCV_345801 [Trichonephila clavipes]|nr:hypothetical protein TNCV_345801 [Trichonephila clavipes]